MVNRIFNNFLSMFTVKYLPQDFGYVLDSPFESEIVQSEELPIFLSGFSICEIPNDNVVYLLNFVESDSLHLVQ